MVVVDAIGRIRQNAAALSDWREVWLKNIGWLKFTAATSACQGGYECGPRFEFAGRRVVAGLVLRLLLLERFNCCRELAVV